jgi:hypothetical protein
MKIANACKRIRADDALPGKGFDLCTTPCKLPNLLANH